MTHWLAHSQQSNKLSDGLETPTRRMIEAAAAFVPANVISFTSGDTRNTGGLQPTRCLPET